MRILTKKGWFYMEQHNKDIGTKEDLMLYRIRTAKENLRSASDYDDFYIASKEEADRQVSVADEFIQLIETYCNKRIEKEQ